MEVEDRGSYELDPNHESRSGGRAGEKRSMYLSRKDFRDHGFTDGCPGCRDIASGKTGPVGCLAGHTKACRKRMEEAIKLANPGRRRRHMERKGEAPVDASEATMASADAPPAAIEEAKDEDEDDGWEGLFEDPPEAEAAGSGLGPAAEAEGRASSSSRAASMIVGHTELVEKLLSVDICEVFSPPRVGLEANKYGLRPGEAMDLTTGWDFNREDHRLKAEQYIDEHMPLAVIGSPPCTPFSQLQNLNPDTPDSRRKWKEGVEHMKFVIRLYRKQIDGGRAFLHEHLAHAKS